MKEKDILIFDIDRTIYDGSVGQDFILELVNEGVISPKILASLSLELVEYELETQNYNQTVKDSLLILASELENKDIKLVEDVAKKVVLYNHYKFYDYIFEIPKVFKEFDCVLLSLEPQILVSEIAKYLKIPNFICNEFTIEKNLFKKTSEIITDKLKLLSNSEFKDRKIFAVFGDSENDLEILKKARAKIVVNPTPKLLEKISGDKDFKISNPKLVYDDFKKKLINLI